MYLNTKKQTKVWTLDQTGMKLIW